MTALASATVLDGSTSIVNLPPLSVFTVSCMVLIYLYVIVIVEGALEAPRDLDCHNY